MSLVLVINAGSSSVKYQLIDVENGQRCATGLIERIGETLGNLTHRADTHELRRDVLVRDHAEAFTIMVEALAETGIPLASLDLAAVGHRVVQGGEEFIAPTLITPEVADRIHYFSKLAPLHNPGEHQAILAAQQVIPDVPHVAVFDTAFHQTMPPAAYTYAIDRDVAAKHGIRRYGFHGTSHAVVSRLAAEALGKPLETVKQIVLHLGNGASATAIDGGRSVDTSMGFTPLEGLVMGTRSGDIDASILIHLMREEGYGADELDTLLNHRSGLVGLTGTGDMRDVRGKAESGDADAALALDVVVHRLRKYVGAYLAVLGGADAITFTAGIGENNAALRARVLEGFAWCGISIDVERNETVDQPVVRISTDDSRVTVFVIRTDEEREIAKQSLEAVAVGSTR